LPEQKISDEKYLKHEEFQRTSKLFTLARVPKNKILRILDVGCGTGLNSKYMTRLGHKVVGIDISHIALKKHCDRGYNGIRANISMGLPFGDASFDMVFASEVLEHLHDTLFFLSESYRTLKPGGLFLLSTPNSAFWVYRLLAIAGKTVSEFQHPGHIRFFSKKSLQTYFMQSEFTSIKISGRHMYILLGDGIASILSRFLVRIGFQKEYRFRTSQYFWHKSRYSSRANGFWTDTFILEARKPKIIL
jgi:2-polyprenyl-3-methyl-5-hydroxy-6-metoxy-1,4-benzoquinol methylase